MRKFSADRLGYFASIIIAVLSGFYLLLLIVFFATKGFIFPPTPFVQLVGGVITLISAQGLVILFSAIRYTYDQKAKMFGSLGLSFIIMFAVTVSINRFVQLTIIQQSLPDIPLDLERFLPYSTGSIMFALEMLGWGLFSSLAFLFIAPLFNTSKLDNILRLFLVLYAVFSFMSVVGFATNTPVTAGAFFAWGPILLVISILFSIKFFRENKAADS